MSGGTLNSSKISRHKVQFVTHTKQASVKNAAEWQFFTNVEIGDVVAIVHVAPTNCHFIRGRYVCLQS